jgi:hypothetical protein
MEIALALMPRSRARWAAFVYISRGWEGNFEQLVRTVGSTKAKVATALMELFEADCIDCLPPGTPTGALEGTAAGSVLIEGTCVNLSESSDA